MSSLTPTQDISTPSQPPRVSYYEAKRYYYGLPSRPVLIARTGSTLWEVPTGLEAYCVIKELRVVGDHEIKNVWEDNLALKVHTILDERGVNWSSTDVVRFGHVNEPSGDVVLWIGVKPDSLSYEVGIDAALECKRLLLDYGINDVEVEIRQSEVVRSAGPQLFQPASTVDPTAGVREPFTPALGIPICVQSTPWSEGTGGFFLDDGSDSKELLLVTARHVVFPQSDNELIERESESQSQRHHDVLLFSQASFQRHLASIRDQAKDQGIIIRMQQRRIDDVARMEEDAFFAEQERASEDARNSWKKAKAKAKALYQDIICIQQKRVEKAAGREDGVSVAERVRKNAHNLWKKAEAEADALTAFRDELLIHWYTDTNRILGHVIFSPPIAIGPGGTEQYTQDVAVIAIDASKLDPSHFTGSVIDLGSKYAIDVLTRMLHPNPKNSHNFEYPGDRLLSLRDTISDDEMRSPTMYDQNGIPCIMVLKRGGATGLTVGRANNVLSYTRTHFGDVSRVSKEWAILPFDHESRAFSAKGDSGSVVVDGAGRIGGLLTSGGGSADDIDMSYATPISFVMKTIHGNELLANADPKWGPLWFSCRQKPRLLAF